MVDIETMSVSVSQALILSVGAVTFMLSSESGGQPDVFDKRLWVLDPGEQLHARRRVDRATQKWWSEQSVVACAHWLLHPGAERISVAQFCLEFASYVDGCEELWANGVVFDIGNLESLWPESPPWPFRAVRDARTIYRHCPEIEANVVPIGGEKHDPIADCEAQVWKLWRHGLR